MVTGASTADLALILVAPARPGRQSRRHAFLCSLLRVPHWCCADKMDLVGFDQQVYDRIADEFTSFAPNSSPRPERHPHLRLTGDNIATRSAAMPLVRRPVPAAPPRTVHIASDRTGRRA